MSWLFLAILLCLVALVGLLFFMGVPDLLLHPPLPETYASPTTVVTSQPIETVRSAPRISEWSTVDEYALAAPAALEKDVTRLAGYLRGATRNDRERIRAIYRWVCDRIAYDGPAHRDHRFPDTDAHFTLQQKKAICGGYAQLVYDLGKAAGLQIEQVVGDSRGGVLSRAGKTEKHAWNAVCLDSKWYLLDATWGAGTVDDDDFTYEKEFNETYFLILPEQLRYSHFPDEPRWQLCAKPLSRAQFLEQPVLTPAFFQFGLSWNKPLSLRLRDPQRLDLKMKEKLDIQAGLLPLQGEELEGATLVNYGDHSACIHIAPPKPGRYRLALLGARWEEDASVDIAEFEVVARRARPGFPEQEAAYVKRHVNLMQPLSGRLKPGAHHFRLEVPGARAVTCGGQPLTRRDGQTFEGDVAVHHGSLSVRAEFEEGTMETLLTYKGSAGGGE